MTAEHGLTAADRQAVQRRIDLTLKDVAMAKAEAEGKTLTDVVIDALTRYVKSKPRKDVGK